MLVCLSVASFCFQILPYTRMLYDFCLLKSTIQRDEIIKIPVIGNEDFL
jgi:hypothetical protein